MFRTEVARFLRFYGKFMQAAPDELTVEVSVIAGEQPVIVAIACWSGDVTRGERVLKPLRSFDAPVADWVDHVAYAHLTDRVSEVGALLKRATSQAQTGPGFNYWRGGSLHELSDGCADQLAAAIEHAPGGCSRGLGHYMHGQICRLKQEATPLIRTAGQVTYFFNASWGDARVGGSRMEWVDRSWKGFSKDGGYVNYLSADDPVAVKASYGGNYERLERIKRKYDSGNFFRGNRNVRVGVVQSANTAP